MVWSQQVVETMPESFCKGWRLPNAAVLVSPLPTHSPWDHAGPRVTWPALLPAPLSGGEEGYR